MWSGPAILERMLRCIQHDWMNTRVTRRLNFSGQSKAAVALKVLRGDKMVHEIAAKRQLHSTQVRTWKRQEIQGMAGVLSEKVKKAKNKDGEIKKLHAKIGQLAVKNDFLLQGLKRWARPLLGSQHPASIRGVMSRNYSSIKQWLES